MRNRLPDEVITDRVQRYIQNEPLKTIAKDHNLTIGGLCSSLKRHAPSIAGTRPRGGGPRSWPSRDSGDTNHA